jgi:hypothetical protein
MILWWLKRREKKKKRRKVGVYFDLRVCGLGGKVRGVVGGEVEGVWIVREGTTTY